MGRVESGAAPWRVAEVVGQTLPPLQEHAAHDPALDRGVPISAEVDAGRAPQQLDDAPERIADLGAGSIRRGRTDIRMAADSRELARDLVGSQHEIDSQTYLSVICHGACV